MKKLLLGSCGVALFLLAAAVIAQETPAPEEKQWFDTEHCAFCKTLADQPGLLDHMTTEYHNTPDGLISFTHIDSAYMSAYAKAQQAMQVVITTSRTTGKAPEMCGHCCKFGEFINAGVQMQAINTAYGIITVYKAPDAAWVMKLHEFGVKAAEGLARYRKDHPIQK